MFRPVVSHHNTKACAECCSIHLCSRTSILERKINSYCCSWVLLEEVVAPKVEAVILVGVPCTNGKVNGLLELPIVYNTNHWIEAVLVVEDDVAA